METKELHVLVAVMLLCQTVYCDTNITDEASNSGRKKVSGRSDTVLVMSNSLGFGGCLGCADSGSPPPPPPPPPYVPVASPSVPVAPPHPPAPQPGVPPQPGSPPQPAVKPPAVPGVPPPAPQPLPPRPPPAQHAPPPMGAALDNVQSYEETLVGEYVNI